MSEESRSWWEIESLDRDRWGPIVEPVLAEVVAARDRDRLPASILLVGPQRLGREAAAVAAAALATCPEAGAVWCGCSSCDRVRRGVHPDVSALLPQGAAGQIRIEQIREVVETVTGRPFEARRRVWIVDGVEAGRLGVEAANAFLKTLEEPPPHAVFILLAANPAAVLPTIASRCQRLSLPGAVAVAARLGETSAPELVTVGLGEAGDAALRRAETVLAAASQGDLIELLRLARELGEVDTGFAVVAAAALKLASEAPVDAGAEDLVLLAGELLAGERRAQALRLSRDRLLLACLLRWYRESVQVAREPA